ncbi:hypothetical protein QYE76_029455 [Lolium multiflorum]|uniref:Integrase catalytic domain-containing protein n=1 Tax=Lolium multiflorum TaxID=4521 RepID=A0AAD8QNM2_LOLMU|nr:hypothetical protein QYE76_029455 [Lolium multiflorum]
MNPKKCAFGVTAGQFLGFLVHERGIEIGLKSQEAVRTMQPPTTKKELQRLIGKINFVRRFISNLSGRIEPFMALVKTKSDDEFHWGAEQQQAFDEIKRYLTTPPVLVPPQQDRPFYIYLSVADTSIASVVVQLYDGVEKVVFYLSRRMLDAETRYPEVEKLCLCLFFTCTKLHHILLTAEIIVICKSDVVKHMLSAPVLKGRLDYFTKWVEAVPMKKVKSEDVIKFVKEHVIHRFGIPQTITTDGGSVFTSKEFRKFCDDMGIKLIRSSPYYAQANGQAEASNQSLIKLIKRKIDENPRDWHEKLSEALWAYRMSCHGAIKTSPYQLVYGQEAVLPWEVTAGSRRVTFQNDLTAEEYAALMSDTIEDATELRLWSLEKIKENKARVARAYNKKVRPKEFQVGDLVWEAVLPLGTRDKAYGKWSPNWHGPYKVVQALKGNAYMLEELSGEKFPVARKSRLLKVEKGKSQLLLLVPNLGAVAALVVAASGAAAKRLLIGASVAFYGSLIFFVVVAVVVPPGAEALRWWVAFKGVVVVIFLRLFLGRGEIIPGEAVIFAFRLLFPFDEELKVALAVGQGFIILGPDGGIVFLLVPRRRGRMSCAANEPHSGVGSREGEES